MTQISLTSSANDQRLAMLALVAGALAIAIAPIFVRISETGPAATAFWRVALAVPVLMMLARNTRPGSIKTKVQVRWPVILCGLFFAVDIGIWHYSIEYTTVANAALLANLAPVFVALAAWALFGERITRLFIIGMALAIIGAALLTGASFSLDPQQVYGDIFGVLTAVFYGAYQLSVARLRRMHAAFSIMAWSSLFSALGLLAGALVLGETLLPQTAAGWSVLFGIALISQVGGQTLITYAFAHLPVSFSSVSLLIHPIMSAALAWVLLGEVLTWTHLIGASVILVGIYTSRLGSRAG
jgi:drug/metabolite transporter (DMT)-like permease